MKVDYQEIITTRYPIYSKLYLPECEPSGVILGIHGFAGDKESSALEALAEAASEKGVALVCFDFPAHGSSCEDEVQLTVANCMQDVQDMAAWCRNMFRDAKLYLFATSFGGYIALLCHQWLEDFSIVLRAPAVTMPEHILTDLLQTTSEAFRQKQMVSCGFERKINLPYRFLEEMQQHSVMNMPCNKSMLILQGDKDDIVPLEDVLAFCESHKTVRLEIIEGADHRFKKAGEIDCVVRHALSYWEI